LEEREAGGRAGPPLSILPGWEFLVTVRGSRSAPGESLKYLLRKG
jgi:hypothetical protein